MLKVMMARPVGDGLRTMTGGGNGGAKTIAVRSPNFHLVHGTIDELFDDKLPNVLWFRFTNTKGKQILINAEHIAWIEETDESRQVTQPS